ncbi:MAG: dynamin family protein [Actinomycetota bacterium]
MTATATPTPAPTAAEAVGTSAGQLAQLLTHLGRTDLVDRVTAAGARLRRPATVVAVVGEFKQGKSSLVNGLLGQAVCPVDDDLATSAITLIRHGEEPAAVVRRRVDGEATAVRIPVDELVEWVSEAGNPGNERGVERVEIVTPSSILANGLVIVDTPGMGGLGAGHAASTMAFLPYADGLILASDASAELSGPEIDLLRNAVELCPTVLFAQTKIDLYPDWQRIVDLNRGHLERAGVRVPTVAVSSHLRSAALARKDRSLNDASRFPELIGDLGGRVIEPAKAAATSRSAADLRAVATLVGTGLREQAAVADDPEALQALIAKIEAANARLEHLRGPGARWAVLVNDRIADLTTQSTHQLRVGLREISREMDEHIETLSSGSQWDELARRLQTDVADTVARVFATVEDGRRSIRAQAVELLQEEDLSLGSGRLGRGDGVDLDAMWRDRSIDGDESGAKAGFRTALTGARGAQGGVLMFGMMGNFLPGAVAAFMATNPVLLGAGALFGGFQLMEDRKRKVTLRRQNARQQVRQFIDDVQLEVGNEVTALVRDIHRDLRDDLTERLADLQRTYTAAAQEAQAQAKRTQEEAVAARGRLDQQLAALDTIVERLDQIGTTS